MHRQEIDGNQYRDILNGFVTERTYAGAMSIVSGRHQSYGRVILIRTGPGFVVIADSLGAVSQKKMTVDAQNLRAGHDLDRAPQGI